MTEQELALESLSRLGHPIVAMYIQLSSLCKDIPTFSRQMLKSSVRIPCVS